MKNYDLKHVAYHILVGLYFMWLVVFGILLSMGLNSAFGGGSLQLLQIYPVWISLNFIMGTSVFVVLRLFRNRTFLSRIINYSYYVVIIAALITLLLIMNKG
ncbi:hypothetical protein Q765_19180 [Flavobacterium rivuli WB 3.3-2 = DSM 21788]|uniref:Uncharacterized protein n=1 Tax=Flavobacterium rivuli WB 3.3-2 = DSM 21788 TaxID=1121895 RepID=A0A0A2LZW9_9FLAO|nr:hypothetical protein Q765_19180 [Flavobacterium rivuli WB 3.3-2 = DSM 21788]